MKSKATFYHAGCPVCVAAEENVARALDPNRYDLEIVHLGQEKQRLSEAEATGVKSVPALVLDGQPFHINHGADLAALKITIPQRCAKLAISLCVVVIDEVAGGLLDRGNTRRHA